MDCRLIGRSRGIYEVGPIRVLGGDLFGISTAVKETELYHTVVVYPERRPFSGLALHSRLFPGSIRPKADLSGSITLGRCAPLSA